MASRRDILSSPPRLPLVFASILGADFGRMAEECGDALEKGADGLHVDVMDGHFVPNLTMGPKMTADLRKRFPDTFLDVHLMVEEPAAFVKLFAQAGADGLTIHVEAAGEAAGEVIHQIHEAGCAAGIALNPATPVQTIHGVLQEVELILIMSVEPGFAGQKFMPQVLEKARQLKGKVGERVRLEIDGGIHEQTAPAAREAGCDVLVAASGIFGAPDRARTIHSLRGA